MTPAVQCGGTPAAARRSRQQLVQSASQRGLSLRRAATGASSAVRHAMLGMTMTAQAPACQRRILSSCQRPVHPAAKLLPSGIGGHRYRFLFLLGRECAAATELWAAAVHADRTKYCALDRIAQHRGNAVVPVCDPCRSLSCTWLLAVSLLFAPEDLRCVPSVPLVCDWFSPPNCVCVGAHLILEVVVEQ